MKYILQIFVLFQQKIDISSVISERLQAVRKLQENPYDIQALNKMHQIQEQVSNKQKKCGFFCFFSQLLIYTILPCQILQP